MTSSNLTDIKNSFTFTQQKICNKIWHYSVAP